MAQAKAAWRKRMQSLTWEEKVATMERMHEHDAELQKAREANRVLPGPTQGDAGKCD